jgi:hypothetical protein
MSNPFYKGLKTYKNEHQVPDIYEVA